MSTALNYQTTLFDSQLQQQYDDARLFVWLLHAPNSANVHLVHLKDGKPVNHNTRIRSGKRLCNLLDADTMRWIDQPDRYISLNVFSGFQRTSENLVGYNAVYTDLDFYKLGITKKQARETIDRMIADGEILPPSLLIDSGRGYQLIWTVDFMKATDGYRKLWRAMQTAIYDRMSELNADNCAKMESQIFRLAGSRSSRTDTVITFEHLADRYTVTELIDWLFVSDEDEEEEEEERFDRNHKLPKSNATPSRARRKKAYIEHGLTPHTLAKFRKKDMEQLVIMRGGRVNRQRLLFYYAIATVDAVGGNLETVESLLHRLNNRFDVPLSDYYIRKNVRTAARHFELKQANKLFGYKFTNEYLLANLEISAEEQEFMYQLIGKDEKNRRDKLRKEKERRAAGIRPMAEYNAERKNAVRGNLERLVALLAEHPKMKQKDIAAALDLSIDQVKRLSRQMKKLAAESEK